jgi:integrase/recombinase XerD
MPPRKAPSTFETAIDEFLTHQRVFGRRYHTEEYVLRAVGRFIARQAGADLNASTFERWCKTEQKLSPNTRYARQLLVRKLCLFRRRCDPRCFVPDPSSFARPRPRRPPVLLTTEQLSALLHAADALPASRHCALRAALMRLAVVLLYTAGLRRGEVVRLQLADVDVRQGVLRIRESKFHKSRWVPLSQDAHHELRRYLRLRLQEPYDRRPSAPLLCNASHCYGHSGWHAYTGAALGTGFRELVDRAGVRDTQGRRPRVQDMRHNFAVEVLCRQYREGGDVQTQLPKLALYMGHVSILSTAYYLHFVPEIAARASERFDQHFSHILDLGAT